MSTELAIVALVAIGVIFGSFVARSSNRREAIRGGAMARGSNFVSAALMAAVTPSVICSATVLELGILRALLVAVVMVALAVVALIPYAIAEIPAIEAAAQQEDVGWTEQDARTSGL